MPCEKKFTSSFGQRCLFLLKKIKCNASSCLSQVCFVNLERTKIVTLHKGTNKLRTHVIWCSLRTRKLSVNLYIPKRHHCLFFFHSWNFFWRQKWSASVWNRYSSAIYDNDGRSKNSTETFAILKGVLIKVHTTYARDRFPPPQKKKEERKKKENLYMIE